MNEPTTRIRPRFSRGQEHPEDTPEKHAYPNYARGGAAPPAEDPPHRGEFATGQERQVHHPEGQLQGRFSRGQERSDP